jgi:hypothetical protein
MMKRLNSQGVAVPLPELVIESLMGFVRIGADARADRGCALIAVRP